MAIATEVAAQDLAESLKRLDLTDANDFILLDRTALPSSSSDQEGEDDSATQDAMVARLLELAEQYERLANGSFRSSFIDGFCNISRAAFNSTRTFGPDSYDLRPYPACKIVEMKGLELSLIDLFKTQRAKEKRDDEREKKNRNEKEEKQNQEAQEGPRSRRLKLSGLSENVDSKLVASDTASSAGASGAQTTSKPLIFSNLESKNTEEAPRYKDPLFQFGGLVPYQLRQAQTQFLSALVHSIKLVELQQKISALIDSIRDTK